MWHRVSRTHLESHILMGLCIVEMEFTVAKVARNLGRNYKEDNLEFEIPTRLGPYIDTKKTYALGQ